MFLHGHISHSLILTKVFNMNEFKTCPKCKSEFEIHRKTGIQYKFCTNCRNPTSIKGYKKYNNCLLCGKLLPVKYLKNRTKPFCDFNHELQFMINNYKTRKQKTGCLLNE